MSDARARLGLALELEATIAHVQDVLIEQFSEPLRAALESGAVAGDEHVAKELLRLAREGRLNALWQCMNTWTLRLAKQAAPEQNDA